MGFGRGGEGGGVFGALLYRRDHKLSTYETWKWDRGVASMESNEGQKEQNTVL